MIIAGQLLLEATDHADEPVRLEPGYVRTDGEQIAEVVSGELPSSADLGGPGHLISPGFVDTHLHLPQFGIIGAHGLPLLEWLERVTFPSETRWADAAYARAMTRDVARQLLACGTTAVCAYSSVHHQATAAAIEELVNAGLRGVVGQSMNDRNAPEALLRSATELLDQTNDLLDRFPPSGRVAAAVTPRFAASSSEELLRGAGALAAAHPAALVQTHLAETLAECEWIAQLFDGRPYADVYDDARLLTPRTLLGHGIHLTDAERALIADRGAVIAHCPTANSFLRSGAINRATTLKQGVRLSLGSDIGAGYERSMVRVARAMVETASTLGADYPNAAHAWAQITSGNADAAGLTDAGRLRVGAPADLLVIQPDLPWQSGVVGPLSQLLFGWDDRWIVATMVRGVITQREPFIP